MSLFVQSFLIKRKCAFWSSGVESRSITDFHIKRWLMTFQKQKADYRVDSNIQFNSAVSAAVVVAAHSQWAALCYHRVALMVWYCFWLCCIIASWWSHRIFIELPFIEAIMTVHLAGHLDSDNDNVDFIVIGKSTLPAQKQNPLLLAIYSTGRYSWDLPPRK